MNVVTACVSCNVAARQGQTSRDDDRREIASGVATCMQREDREALRTLGLLAYTVDKQLSDWITALRGKNIVIFLSRDAMLVPYSLNLTGPVSSGSH